MDENINIEIFEEDMMDLDETTLRKFINNCPKCGGELKPYTPLPGLPPANAYCPSCDILRISYSSFPFICENCNSTTFYNEDREKMSEIDGLVVEKHLKLYDKKSFFTKGFVYRDDISEEEKNKLIEDIKKLQEQRPRDICWFCGGDKFTRMKSDKLFEMERRGELKIGYKISENFVPVKHECKERADGDIVRVTKMTYRASCKCGYEEYVLIPKWQQEEIREIRALKGGEGNDSVDKITMEELDMTQKIPIITFSGDKDLLEKVEKAIKRHENT